MANKEHLAILRKGVEVWNKWREENPVIDPRSIQSAGMEWDSNEAHSAVYDAEMTAMLFCKIVNETAFVSP